MRPFIHALSLFAFCAPLAHAEIDWTPRFVVTSTEAGPIRRLYFADGEKKYAVAFDGETTATPDRGGVRFTYEKVSSGIFTIQPQRPALVLPGDPKTLEDYRKLALACAPETASDFQEIEMLPDALPINKWQSLRFTFSYNYYGQRKRHCVTFLTGSDGKQVRLETTALATEFDQVQARAEHLIRSWHELAPREVIPSQS